MSIRLVDARCGDYFDTLWRQAGDDLAAEHLDRWAQKVTEHPARGGRPCDLSGLGDEGVDVGEKPESPDFVQDNQGTQDNRGTQSADTMLVFYANHFLYFDIVSPDSCGGGFTGGDRSSQPLAGS